MADETSKFLPNPLNIIPMKEKVMATPTDTGMGALVGDIGSRPASTVSDAINADGNLVTDVINDALDTSASDILGDFTFGESGALTMQTDADNGLWISANGILAKKAGENTLTVTTAGDVTMIGTITASAGSIGGWNINSTSIYTGTEDHDGYTTNAGDMTIYSNGTDSSIHAKNFYIDTLGKLTATSATISGNITITGGSGIASLTDAGALATEDTADFDTQVSGAEKPANNATVGADWTTNLINIPGTLATPSGAGLYLSATNLGYYDSSDWKTYMDNSGNFYLGGTSGKLQWNAGTDTLTINGIINLAATSSGIANFSDSGDLVTMNEAEIDQTNLLNAAAAGATVGADWNVDLSNIPATLGTPSSDGLYLSSDYLGYYKSGAWTSFIKNDGDFYFAGDDDSSIDWNVSTPSTLTIKGKLETGTGSTINGTYIDNLSVNKLTAGTITSKEIVLATDSADCFITAGKTDFGQDTTNGFILGRDYSDSNKAKLEITGGTITSPVIQTDISGARTVIDGNDIYSFDDSTGGSGAITGNTATHYFPRTDDEDQRFIIRKRAGINFDEENVMELFYDKEANPDTSAQETEYKNPASNKTVDGLESYHWTNPTYAYYTNGYFATSTQGDAKYHCWYNYSMGIPSTATILGITVSIKAKASTTDGSPEIRVNLTKNKNDAAGDLKRTPPLNTTNTTYTLGGDNDLWGTTWSASDFGTNFGVSFVSGTVSSTPETIYYIDSIRIKVRYYFSADFPRENYFFLGRAGDQTAEESKLDIVSTTFNNIYELDHPAAYSPVFEILSSNYSGAQDVGGWGQGLSGGTRNMLTFKDMGTAAVFSDSPSFQVYDTITGNSSGATAYIGAKTDDNNYTLVFVHGTFDPDNDDACTTDGAGGGTGTGNLSSVTSTEFSITDGSGGGTTLLGYQAELGDTTYLGAQLWTDAYNIWVGEDLKPYTDAYYDIGDADHQVKDIYISGTIIGGDYKPTGYKVSDDLLASADTARVISNAEPYTKIKEIRIPGCGDYRIKFDLKGDGTWNGYGKIYKNGVAIGTQRITDSATYVTYSQDFTGLISGDLIQLYAYSQDVNHPGYVRNFRIYGAPTSDFTINTD